MVIYGCLYLQPVGAVFSISLIHRKSQFSILARFTLMSFMGAIFLFPFFIIENIYFIPTTYDLGFLFLYY